MNPHSVFKNHLWWILLLLGLALNAIIFLFVIQPSAQPIVYDTPVIPTSTPTATAIPTVAPTLKPLAYNLVESPTDTPTPTATNTGTPTKIPPPTQTSTQTNTPTITPTPTETPFGHRYETGDDLALLASQYDVALQSLLDANDLGPGETPEGEQWLIIPRKVKIIRYQVQRGDTLLGIAARQNSSVEKIEAANPELEQVNLRAGMVLTVPILYSIDSPTPAPNAPDATPTPVYHAVQRGESPLKIALDYDVSVDLILQVNNITNPRALQVGQRLIIPPSDKITLGVPVILHDVLEGETLIGIVSKYGSSVRDVLYVNPDLAEKQLAVGDTIGVPIVFPLPVLPDEPRADDQEYVPPLPPDSLPGLERQMIALMNEARTEIGLHPLTQDDGVHQLALTHAQDMVVRRFFAHTNPDGATVRDRFIVEGWNRSTSVGENIQRNSRPAEQTVQSAFNWFMNSPPHRANILHQKYRRVGVGIVQGTGGRAYTYVINFSE